MSENNYGPDYTEIDVESATVVTVIPYAEGPEFREYEIAGRDVAEFLATMDDPQHAERVVSVDVARDTQED